MRFVKKFSVVFLILMIVSMLAIPAYAAEDADASAEVQTVTETAETAGESSVGLKAIAVGVAIGLAAAGGAVGMGIVGGKAADGISRQPDMEGNIRTTLMLDLVFIETAIIYALLVVILVIFVL